MRQPSPGLDAFATLGRVAILCALVIAFLQVEDATAQPAVPGLAGVFSHPNVRRGVLGHGFEVSGIPTPKIVLLQNTAIRNELKLSPTQQTRMDKIDREHRLALDTLMMEFGKSLPPPKAFPDEEDIALLQERNQAIQQQRQEIRQSQETAVFRLLSAAQHARLDEIQLQSDGFSAFTRADLQERLNMSPEQIEAASEIVAQGRDRFWTLAAVPVPQAEDGESADSLTRRFQGEVEKTRASVVKERALLLQQISKILSKKQVATYRRLLGVPFDFNKMRVGQDQRQKKPDAPSRPAGSQKESANP